MTDRDTPSDDRRGESAEVLPDGEAVPETTPPPDAEFTVDPPKGAGEPGLPPPRD